MKGSGIIILIIGIIVLIIGAIIFGLQKLEKAQWGQFAKVVHVDNRYYYTNEIKEVDGCINFIDNYGKDTTICEKYQAEDNYWFKNSPSLTTVIWSP